MNERRTIGFLLYDGFELLDMAGPASVFAAANRAAGQSAYNCIYLSLEGGTVTTSAGIDVGTAPACSAILGPHDTLMVVGADGPPLATALADAALLDAIRSTNESVGRIASICTGAFLLGEAGILDTASVTTHWAARDRLARRYPGLRLADDALYVTDGRCWTSAGVTTGIDMALAMLRADMGLALMRIVARQLVVHSHRPGKQSQFSQLLDTQTKGRGDFSDLIIWMEANLHEPLGVADLARQCTMSERSFYRKFVAATGRTPSRFLEDLRLARARQLVEAGMAIKAIAAAVGYRSDSALRAAFKDKFGVSPSTHRLMNSAT